MDKDAAGRAGPSRSSRRQRSLPSPSATPFTRQAQDLTNLQPASPEVISSLISSLSAISTPAHHHFENLPNIASTRSEPCSPNPQVTEFSLITDPQGYVYKTDAGSPTISGCGIDYGTYNNPQQSPPNQQLYPDDAAIAPIVRTSKSPSGSWSLNASKWSSPASRELRGMQSHIRQTSGGLHSIGGLSIEPGLRLSSANTASYGGAVNKRSKSPKDLITQPSKERMREFDREHKRKNTHIFKERDPNSETFHVRVGSQSSPVASPLGDGNDNEGRTSRSPGSPERTSFTHGSEKEASKPDAPDFNPSVNGNGHIVPARESSLRHSHVANSSRRKRRSHRLEPKSVPEEQNAAITEDEAPQLISAKISDDPEEDEVSRRIMQLKAQKMLRDRPPPINNGRVSSPEMDCAEGPILCSSQGSQDLPNLARVSGGVQISLVKEPQPGLSSIGDVSASPSAQILIRDQPRRLPTNLMAPMSTSKTVTSVKSPAASQQVQVESERTSILLRRLSRPASPISSDKHKRNVSSPLSPSDQNPYHDDRPSTADSIDNAVNDYLYAPRLMQKIRHPQTGRVISFSDVGDPTGSAVFCCVGMGLTRYITAFYDELALTLKLRLITPDRPGVGGSDAYSDGSDTPLGWPDDVLAICQHLKISKFSILAHSAGAIYALATALRMPQHIRGRIHLLAPWIPPSQMSSMGSHKESLPVSALPYSQRILRSLPTQFLKVANSSFLSTASASLATSLPKSPRRANRKSLNRDTPGPSSTESTPSANTGRRISFSPRPKEKPASERPLAKRAATWGEVNADQLVSSTNGGGLSEKSRRIDFDTRLTHAIWDLATAHANPAVDLLVCLERRQPIGFRYVDITKAVVIHHGSRDTRVPVENVKWLSKTMRRCEVRVLDGEGHGLMASATVMGAVLMEMAKEWDDWNTLVAGKRGNIEKRTAVG